MSDCIRVVVCGACGKMGRETAKAVSTAEDMDLVGVCDVSLVGRSYAQVSGLAVGSLLIRNDLGDLLGDAKPDAVVDFTEPDAVMQNAQSVLSAGIPAVIGTTGLTAKNLQEIEQLALAHDTAALVAPNFAIGAVLMMKFAAEAAKHLPAVEIIELHHDKKLDAPSGTSLKTAEMVAAARQQAGLAAQSSPDAESRGMDAGGVRIHSVRLQGLVAHQEVIFGGQGQTLTIRHDSLDRSSFMPGVLTAIRKVQQLKGLIYGLENIL